MAENNFLTYKEKPLVRSGNEIYYGDMAEPYVIKFNILSAKKDGEKEIPDKVSVQLLKKIREEMKFSGLDELRAQIARDREVSKKISAEKGIAL